MTATLDHLRRLYARTDDPWNFEASPYEQTRFARTRDALSRPRYRAALEIGCGNGALACHLAPLCARYVGLDAMKRAIDAARIRVPRAEFHLRTYPCPLPDGPFDLVILSEVLYFLTPVQIARLGPQIARSAPDAEILCVTFLGDTDQELQGPEALTEFRSAMQPWLDLEPVFETAHFRIDRGQMRGLA